MRKSARPNLATFRTTAYILTGVPIQCSIGIRVGLAYQELVCEAEGKSSRQVRQAYRRLWTYPLHVRTSALSLSLYIYICQTVKHSLEQHSSAVKTPERNSTNNGSKRADEA